MAGFQLWVNLPAKDKMCAPWYRDIASSEIPEFTTQDGVTARVIAGESHGTTGAMTRETTAPLYLDLHFSGAQRFAQPLPAGHNAFIFVYRGMVQVAGQAVTEKQMAILANERDADGVVLEAAAPARALLIAGRPLHEPIAQYGPFVMNNQRQLYEAISDFQSGKF